MEHTPLRHPFNTSGVSAIQSSLLSSDVLQDLCDRILRLAIQHLHAPTAWIVSVGAAQHLFTRGVGLPEPWAVSPQAPIASSLCARIAASGEPLAVADIREPAAELDAFVAATGSVAYIGVPIQLHDHVIGIVCVGDKQARTWAATDRDALQNLAAVLTAALDPRHRTTQTAHLEAQYHLIFDSLDTVIFQTDPQGRWTMLNHAWTVLTGFAVQESLGQQALDFISPRDHLRATQCVTNILSQVDTAGHLDVRLLTIDGDVRWMHFRAQGIVVDGQLVGLIGLLSDLTARKLSETLLMQSEERFRQLTDHLHEVFFLLSLDTNQFMYLSPAFEQVWCRSRENVYGKPELFFEAIHHEDQARHQAGILRVTQGYYETLEYRVFHPDGSMRWIRSHCSPIRNEGGRIYRMAGTAEDVTVQKRAEEERDRFFTVSSDLLCITGNDGFFKHLNPAWEHVLGFTIEALRRTPFLEIMHPFDRPQAQAAIQQLERKETSVVTIETRCGRNDGEYRWFQWQGSVHADSSLVRYWVGRDITERKQAEYDLHIANIELARAARLKDEFLANMSHELRTPLNVVLGFVESLQEGIYGPINEEQLMATSGIIESSHRLLTLINDILDLSKIEAGKIVLQQDTVHVANLCATSLQTIRQLAEQKQITLSLSGDHVATTMRGDLRRLKQILVNLLSNAVKFTPLGGAIALQVRTDAQTQQIHFSVYDTGIGIDPDNLARLFQPFVQLDSSLARQYAGTGLGLALVAGMTKLHGGSVSVTSVVGTGSQFRISLPWSESDASHTQ